MSVGTIPTIVLLLSVLLGSVYNYSHRDRNLALRKPTAQISTLQYTEDGITHPGNSARAVDGNVKASGINMTCASTDYHVGETWWMVDLEDIYFITEVRILPFFKGHAVKNFSIEASLHWDNTSGKMIRPVICYKESERIPRGEMNALPCYPPVMGRYIRIAKYRDKLRQLSFCEVEVYGKSTVRFNVLDVREGKRSRNHQIDAVRSQSAVACSAICRSHEECTSFNMAAEGGVCVLIADPIGNEDGNEESTPGWTHYIMK